MIDSADSSDVAQLDVLVIGGGPAGLAAARALALNGVRDVTVIEREQRAGGVPRHCDHTGFGLRDLHRAMSGPNYADALVRRAEASGVRILTETMATSWIAPGQLSLSSAAGVRAVAATAIVLATGARERPRTARLIPGDRAAGVFTTGQLQQWSHQHHLAVGQRAVVVGAEHVSYSAVVTLRDAGVETVAMVTDLPRHQTYPAFAAATRWGLRVPLWTDTTVAALRGHGRLREVDLHNTTTATTRTVAADTIVFTGDWVPDNELARSAGLVIDASSKGPVVDGAGEASTDGMYAAGNVVHPGETADIAALRGAAVGVAVARHLERAPGAAEHPGVGIIAAAPLLWSAPGRIVPTDAAANSALPQGLIVQSAEFRHRPTLVVAQGGRQLARFRLREVVPHRSIRVPLDWSPLVRPDAGEIHLDLA